MINQKYNYCPYCGYKLGYHVFTDANSVKECKTSTTICKRPKMNEYDY